MLCSTVSSCRYPFKFPIPRIAFAFPVTNTTPEGIYVLHNDSCFIVLHQRTTIYKDLNMFKCLLTIIFLFLCFDISVISVISVNVSPPLPVPIPIPIPFTYNLPFQLLVKSRVVLRTFFSYKYVTVD